MAQVARAQTEAAGGPEHLRRLAVQSVYGRFLAGGDCYWNRRARCRVELIDTVAVQGEKEIIRNAEPELEISVPSRLGTLTSILARSRNQSRFDTAPTRCRALTIDFMLSVRL